MPLSFSFEEIKKVVEAPGIPNFEEGINNVLLGLLSKNVRSVSEPSRLTVEFNPGGQPFILVGAHSDVLGARITEVTDDGFIHFATTGSSHTGWLEGHQVTLYPEMSSKDPVRGVIGHKALHHLEAEEKYKTPKVYELFVDIGAKSRLEVEKTGLQVGDPIVYSTTLNKLPLNQRIVGRGLDNRSGVLTLLEVCHKLHKSNNKSHVVVAFWGGEEVGLTGGFKAAAEYHPEIMINVDVGFATRTPATSKEKSVHGSVDLGEGVIINRGGVLDPGLAKTAYTLALKKKIKTQFSVVAREPGTDATPFNRTTARVLDLGIPCRYMHYDEVVDLADIASASNLIVELLKSF